MVGRVWKCTCEKKTPAAPPAPPSTFLDPVCTADQCPDCNTPAATVDLDACGAMVRSELALPPPQPQREKLKKSQAAVPLPKISKKKTFCNPSTWIQPFSSIKDYFRGPLPPSKAVYNVSPANSEQAEEEREWGEDIEEVHAAASPSSQSPTNKVCNANESTDDSDLTLKQVMAAI